MGAATREAANRWANGTFRLADYCEFVDSGRDVDVETALNEFDAVLSYRERIGIMDRALAKQFNGFREPRYKENWFLPVETAIRNWEQATADTYVKDAAYELWSTGDHLLCTVTATLLPQSDIDPETGERQEYTYGLGDGDLTITGVLSDDAALTDYDAAL